jgi:hypothetical protein
LLALLAWSYYKPAIAVCNQMVLQILLHYDVINDNIGTDLLLPLLSMAKAISTPPADKLRCTECNDTAYPCRCKRSAHTAGPWNIEELEKTDTFVRVRIHGAKPEYDLASAIHVADVLEETCGTNEAKANARLIAAAPKLLEFLKDNLKYFAEDSLVQQEAIGLVAKTEGRV